MSIWGLVIALVGWRKEREAEKAARELLDRIEDSKSQARTDRVLKGRKLPIGRMLCPSCGLEVAEFDQKCWKCGAALHP